MGSTTNSIREALTITIPRLKSENKKMKSNIADMLELLKLADKWLYVKGAYKENANDPEIIKFRSAFSDLTKNR